MFYDMLVLHSGKLFLATRFSEWLSASPWWLRFPVYALSFTIMGLVFGFWLGVLFNFSSRSFGNIFVRRKNDKIIRKVLKSEIEKNLEVLRDFNIDRQAITFSSFCYKDMWGLALAGVIHLPSQQMNLLYNGYSAIKALSIAANFSAPPEYLNGLREEAILYLSNVKI